MSEEVQEPQVEQIRVRDGLVRISPSQIKTFRECHRKWAWDRIDRVPRVTTGAQQGGIDKHTEVEKWLKERILPGPVVQQLIRTDWLPVPGADLLIEQDFERPLIEIANDTLLIGYMDFIDPRERTLPVVGDNKFTSDLKWAMDHNELLEDPQAIIYGKVVMEGLSTDEVVARWLYAAYSRESNTPKGGRRVQVLFTKETIKAKWDGILETCSEIRETKLTKKSALEVLPNPSACQNYGGCQYISMCPISSGERLAAHQIQFMRSQGEAPLVVIQDDAKNISTTKSEPVISREPNTSAGDPGRESGGSTMVDFAKRTPAAAPPNGAAPPPAPPAAPAGGPPRPPAAAGTPGASFRDRVGALAGVNPPESALAQQDAAAPPAAPPAAPLAAPSTPAEAAAADAAPKRTTRRTKAAAEAEGTAMVPAQQDGAVYTVIALKCIGNALEAAGRAIHETLASMGR